jgi:acetylornithine/LysW-gamma-L-lysine aminotransferase
MTTTGSSQGENPLQPPLGLRPPRTPNSTIGREDAHTSGLYTKRQLAIVRGEGALLYDEDGREYIDCVGGQGSANLGHGNAAVADALAAQARTLASCTELFYNDRRAELYDVLAGLLPPSLDRVFLCNSGTEAVEGALKFARAATKRPGVVATMRGFHGKTMGALSATWGPEYRDVFGPLVPGFSHVPFNKPEALDAAITPETAAFIVELVQGEGGVRPATREFIAEAARLCRDRGALLVFDEVQTGFCRTGTMFAFEQYGVVPDILCLAKSIAGGLPMGAIAFSRAVGELPKRSHSSTFGGNPLACAAAIAAIGEMRRLDLATRARERGAQLLDGLRAIRSDKVREVRGLGLLAGIELKENAGPTIKALQEEGVLAMGAGPTVVRYLPPLVISAAQIDRVLEATAKVLA